MSKTNIDLRIRSAEEWGPCVCCDKDAIGKVLVADFGEDDRIIMCEDCVVGLEIKLSKIKERDWK